MACRGAVFRSVLDKSFHVILGALDRLAYGLVPKAMTAAFGQQGAAWGTEKRPSKGGSGLTTWIVVK